VFIFKIDSHKTYTVCVHIIVSNPTFDRVFSSNLIFVSGTKINVAKQPHCWVSFTNLISSHYGTLQNHKHPELIHSRAR